MLSPLLRTWNWPECASELLRLSAAYPSVAQSFAALTICTSSETNTAFSRPPQGVPLVAASAWNGAFSVDPGPCTWPVCSARSRERLEGCAAVLSFLINFLRPLISFGEEGEEAGACSDLCRALSGNARSPAAEWELSRECMPLSRPRSFFLGVEVPTPLAVPTVADPRSESMDTPCLSPLPCVVGFVKRAPKNDVKSLRPPAEGPR